MITFLLLLFLASLAALAFLSLLWLAFGFLKYKRQRSIPRPLVTTTLIVVLVSVATYVYPFRPTMLRGRQIRTFANMQVIRAFLDDQFESHGQYPQDLDSVFQAKQRSVPQDGWESQYLYDSRGDSYILVGLGSDGKKDGSDYWRLRESVSQSESVAREWKADQVASDIGWHRQAGK
jgi:Type II secretion system (T2SS), protein G